MSPDTQAGTDRAALKEQARLAMLRAPEDDESTDAQARDDEHDDVGSPDEDEHGPEAEENVEDADEVDETDDEADGGAESDDGEDDGDAVEEEDAPPSGGKQPGKRKQGKVAKLHKQIDDLKGQLKDRDQSISDEVERALAARNEANAEVQRLRDEQEEDAQRVGQVREYVGRLRGSDRELDQLTRDVASTEDLDPLALNEQQRDVLRKKKARLNQIISARDVYDLASEAADADLRDRVGRILGELAESLPGVDKDFHNKLKFAPAVQHVYDSAYERGRSESARTIAQHEKTIANLEGKLLAAGVRKAAPAKSIPEGGRSPSPSPKPKTPDQMTPLERLKAKGAIGADGRIDPEFKKKLHLGLVSLVG